jgi:hypothetical protein
MAGIIRMTVKKTLIFQPNAGRWRVPLSYIIHIIDANDNRKKINQPPMPPSPKKNHLKKEIVTGIKLPKIGLII